MKIVKLALILTTLFLQAGCQETLSRGAKDKHTDSILFLDKSAANWEKEAFPLVTEKETYKICTNQE